ncbi:hypothetical protein HDU78_000606 [Chytriomyces hyalinus]|uniref:RRM domain-containing protein n=1 Tax=Chytriomyces confervae TaxID=246404 RepID=A0A507FN64_9FUNG|nr:hypothetical protein HDU78_000606 [Chytriomyces hyalinus]KAJ3267049.1 hypothetical protein HDU77_006989 [Chytriomyces hyalinus]KAJ3410185.1 hypothetical protein HDU80_000007 [Chytriomyces hyalinus]TPX77859.1 hypothetical protein CcCBS67573_g00885 [Chytriomyces confervae]
MSDAAPATPAPATVAPPQDNSPKVFVGNLAFSTTEADLAAAFTAGGAAQVLKATIIRRNGRPQGYGFVAFETESAAQDAVKVMNQKEVGGRPVNVDFARPREVREPREPRAPREPRVQASEGADAAAPEKKPRKARKPKKAADTEESADNAARIDAVATDDAAVVSGTDAPKKKRNKKRSAKKPNESAAVAAENATAPADGAAPAASTAAATAPQPKPRAPRPPKKQRNPDAPQSKTTLFVANLPFKVDNDALKRIFSEYNVTKAYVVRLRNGRSKGFGFIEVADEAEQSKILKDLDEASLNVDGRDLSVRVAVALDVAAADGAADAAVPATVVA